MDERMLVGMLKELDGEFGSKEQSGLEGARLQALDQMLCQEPMARPPVGFTGRVVARVDRRRHRQRVLFGGMALGFGTVATALLLVCFPLLSLPPVTGGLGSLVDAGRVSVVGLGQVALTLLGSLWVTFDALILRILPVAVCGFSMAFAANLVWLGLIRKLHRAPARVQFSGGK